MGFYIIRLIKKKSKPSQVEKKDDLSGDWKDKFYPLFNENYQKDDIEVYVFDSNKQLIFCTGNNPNYTTPTYEDVKKLVNKYDVNEMIVDNSEMSILSNIQRFESGLFDSNLL